MAEPASNHYRVVHITSERIATARTAFAQTMRFAGRKLKQAWTWRHDPLPNALIDAAYQADDIVRLLDRDGTVVREQTFTDRRKSISAEQGFVEDLLHMDVATFRAKYHL